MAEVLEGIRVLDFTRGMPGAVATMVLSDFGAEVVKVEPPQGDPFRSLPGALLWDRGKKSVTLDLHEPTGQERARRLAADADVVVESFRPGTAERLGIAYEALSAGHPALVYASISGFGRKGPYARYKGYEGIVAAKAGRMMAFNGQNRREDGPNYGAVQVASHAAAMATVRGIVAALSVRDRTGQGQRVDTSLLQGLSTYDMHNWIVWQMMIKDPDEFPNDPQGDPMRLPGLPYLPARTKDGRWIQMANLMDRLFHASVHATGLDAIYQDPRFETAPALTEENREALRRIMLERMREKTLEEWMDLFVHEAPNVGAEPFMTTQEGMGHPQSLHNGHVVQVDDPRVGPMRQLGPLFKVDRTPASVKGPAPSLGQHNDEILGTLDGAVGRPERANGGAPLPRHPLEGVTILDCATIIAGPLGASLFGELGARVIRVEPLEGDWMRRNVKGITTNRTMGGTESISLDLKTPEGQEIMAALIRKADLLVHNMRPGAPERVGIGYEQARTINPRLVYLYVGGYGAEGPHAHRPAMHPIPGAVDGGALAQAGRGTPPPPETPLTMDEVLEVSRRLGRANEANPDPNTSMGVATALMLGLYARERLDVAQYLEMTMLCANAYANADDFFSYEGKPPRAIPDREGYGLSALYRLYAAQGGWVFLACPFEHEWRALCHAIGRGELLEDARFATPEDRARNDDALAHELSRVFASRPPLEWERTLVAADVACVQAENRGMYHFFAEDPHVRENGLTTDVEHLRFGTFWRHSPMITFSRTPGRVGPGPLKGQHTLSVLQELGYTQEQVEALRSRGVVDWEAV